MRTLAAALALLAAACATAPPLDEARAVDLTHPLDHRTLAWPTARPFELEHVARGHDAEGRWYASSVLTTSEHAGTHLDAPLHFAERGRATGAIPLRQLIAPVRVLDVRAHVHRQRDYQVRPDDVAAHEQVHGRIPAGAAVLVLTGFGELYGDRAAYFGTTSEGSADDLHFPGLSPEVAKLLAARRVDLVGIDTASLDPGTSRDFAAHRLLAEAQIPGLENLANLQRLPARGATLIALPLPLTEGTGSPARVIAFVP